MHPVSHLLRFITVILQSGLVRSCAAVEATDAALDEVTDDIAAGCTRG